MAESEVSRSYPNILLVYGTDVYHPNSDGDFDVDPFALQNYFSSDPANSPVARFSHDFWITHPVDTAGSYFKPGTVLHELVDGTSDTYRDFRGVVKMGYDFSSLDGDKAKSYLNTLLQEMGHYWLVPSDMTFGDRPVADANEFAEAFLNRRPYPDLELLGRCSKHWSSHIERNPSPLDGLDWQAQETYTTEGVRADPNILRRYTVSTESPNTLTIQGVGDIGYGAYPDLDRVIMGVMPKDDAYAVDGNGFYQLLPVWADPVNMLGGLVMVFDEAHVVTFGFLHGISTIGISQTGTRFPESWDISLFYKPWELGERIVFRVVRKNSEYYFQAKQEFGNIGCLGSLLRGVGLYTALPATDPFENSDSPSAAVADPTDLRNWTTLKVISNPNPPIAVGYGCKTWSQGAPWVDINFRPLALKTEGTALPEISTDPASIRAVSSPYISSLTDATFIFHRPADSPGEGCFTFGSKSLLTGDRSSCNIAMNVNGDNWIGIDNMPKLLVKAPGSDFVAAGSVHIARNILSPWAAGDYLGVSLWSYRKKIQVAGLALNPDTDYRRVDPGGPYKVAFMIVAATRSDITDSMIENLDKLRVAYETVFSVATNAARSVNSSLS